jgi:CubicO group peptidase (beta-lactamase class C family)
MQIVKKSSALIISLLLAAILSGCSTVEIVFGISEPVPTVEPFPTVELSEPDYWPTQGWETANLSNQDAFLPLDEALNGGYEYIDSMLVIYDGYIVYEAYPGTYSADDLHQLMSVTKSVTSAVVGLAVDRGDIPSLDITAGEVFPEYFTGQQNSETASITLRDALMMRTGLAEDVFNLDNPFATPEAFDDVIQHTLSQDLVGLMLHGELSFKPGEAWRYSTGDSQLVSAMFQELTGRSLEDYAKEYLFTPLNITDYSWTAGASGYSTGGFGLYLKPRDMAKFGFLYLHNGQWEDQTVISQDWVRLTTSPQPRGINTDNNKREDITWYGYDWWLWEPWEPEMPSGAFQAVGYGGQTVFVLPDVNSVVVATSNYLVTTDVSDSQQEELNNLIAEKILPALIEETAAGGQD